MCNPFTFGLVMSVCCVCVCVYVCVCVCVCIWCRVIRVGAGMTDCRVYVYEIWCKYQRETEFQEWWKEKELIKCAIIKSISCSPLIYPNFQITPSSQFLFEVLLLHINYYANPKLSIHPWGNKKNPQDCIIACLSIGAKSGVVSPPPTDRFDEKRPFFSISPHPPCYFFEHPSCLSNCMHTINMYLL